MKNVKIIVNLLFILNSTLSLATDELEVEGTPQQTPMGCTVQNARFKGSDYYGLVLVNYSDKSKPAIAWQKYIDHRMVNRSTGDDRVFSLQNQKRNIIDKETPEVVHQCERYKLYLPEMKDYEDLLRCFKTEPVGNGSPQVVLDQTEAGKKDGYDAFRKLFPGDGVFPTATLWSDNPEYIHVFVSGMGYLGDTVHRFSLYPVRCIARDFAIAK